MEATKISFFKKTKESMNKELSPQEKGKIRLDRINKLCPDSGATFREMMKIAGYDPGLKKEYNKGAAFINYHKKKGNIVEIPNLSGNKRDSYLLIPNSKKVKTTKIEKNIEAPKIDVVKIEKNETKKFTAQLNTLSKVTISIVEGNNSYNFEFNDIDSKIAKNRISKIMESFDDTNK